MTKETLIGLDGLPASDLATRVWWDLTRVGIRAYIGPEELGADEPGGASLADNGDWVLVLWTLPDEARAAAAAHRDPVRTGGTGDPEVDERDLAAAERAVGAWHAAGLLTGALAGILSTLGYRVESQLPEYPRPAALFIRDGS